MLKNRLLKIALLIIAFLITNSFSYDQWVNNLTYNVGDTIEYSSEVWTPARFVYQNTPPPNTWFWIKCANTSGGTTRAGEIYDSDSYEFIVDLPIPSIIPKTTSGYTLSNFTGNLPTGMNLNNSTGEISGTPTSIPANNSYTITAVATPTTGSSYNITHSINIDVKLFEIEYPQNVLYLSLFKEITTIKPKITGNVTSFTTSSLPKDIKIDVNTGEISGSANECVNSIVPITVSNSHGSDTINIQFDILGYIPNYVSGKVLNLTDNITFGRSLAYLKNTSVLQSIQIQPQLPTGLILNQNTGIISGKSDYAIPATKFKVWFKINANGSNKEISHTFYLEIVENNTAVVDEVRDFFNDDSIMIDNVSKEEIELYGFYNNNGTGKQPRNIKSTYAYSPPVLANDRGIIFTSTFDAEVVASQSENGFGLVNRNSNGTYNGIIYPTFNFTGTSISNPNPKAILPPESKWDYDFDERVIWYFQDFLTGNIYKIHEKKTINNDLGWRGSGWSTHCIPNSDLVFIYCENGIGKDVIIIDINEVATLNSTTSNTKFKTIIPVTVESNPDTNTSTSVTGIDSRYYQPEYIITNDPSTNKIRMDASGTNPEPLPYDAYASSSHSLNSLGTSNFGRVGIHGIRVNIDTNGDGKNDEELKLAGYIDIEYDNNQVNPGATAVCTLKIFFRESCVYTDISPSSNTVYGDYNSDCDCYKSSLGIDGWVDHILPSPSENVIFFTDEHAHEDKHQDNDKNNPKYRDIAERIHFYDLDNPFTPKSTYHGTNFYTETNIQEFDRVINEVISHQSVSADGNWVYACREYKNIENLPPGVIRISTDRTKPQVVEQVYTHFEHFRGHQDNSLDGKNTVFHSTLEDIALDLWDIYIVDNDTKNVKKLCRVDMSNVRGSPIGKYAGHPFTPKPSFSITGNHVVFQTSTNIQPDNTAPLSPISAVGVINVEKTKKELSRNKLVYLVPSAF